MSFTAVAVVTVKENNCRIYFWGISKNEAMNRMKNANLSEKSGQLW